MKIDSMQRNYKRKEKKRHLVPVGITNREWRCNMWQRLRPGLEPPLLPVGRSPRSITVERTRTKAGPLVSVGKPGLEGVSRPGLKSTPALVVKIQYPIGPSYRLHIYVTQIFDQVAYENEPAPDDRACHLQ